MQSSSDPETLSTAWQRHNPEWAGQEKGINPGAASLSEYGGENSMISESEFCAVSRRGGAGKALYVHMIYHDSCDFDLSNYSLTD